METPGAWTARGCLPTKISGLQGGARGSCCQVESNHGQQGASAGLGRGAPPSQGLLGPPWGRGLSRHREPSKSLALCPRGLQRECGPPGPS